MEWSELLRGLFSSGTVSLPLPHFLHFIQYLHKLGIALIPTNPILMKQYWKKNLTYLAILLGIWFLVSFGFGILFVDELDQIRIGGFKLGFWFAQQGSIYVFIVLIFVYVKLMNKLDKDYDVED